MKNRLIQRKVIALGGSMLLVAALAACSAQTPPQTTEPTDSGEPVEITFASFLRNSAAVVDAYNAAQDDVIVTFEEVPATENYTQLLNRQSAGTLPDVVTTDYAFVAEMATQGVLQDIKEQAGSLVSENYPEAIQDLVNFGDALWGIPLDVGVMQLYYRADRFEELGIEVPTTWDEYAEAAAAVKAADPNSRIGASITIDDLFYPALAWQAGGQWADVEGDAWKINIDDKASAEVAKTHQALLDNDLVWADAPEVLNQKQADGTMLSVISGSWYAAGLASTYPDQSGLWRVAQLPSPTSEPATAMRGGSAFGVSSDSEHVDAAVDFITWMTTTPEGIEARIAGGASSVFPVSEDAREVASAAFDPTFFGGQDIYDVALAGYESIPAG